MIENSASITEHLPGNYGDASLRFTHEMRNLLDNHAVLHHRFFSILKDRSRAPSVVKFWALQDRHIAYMFPGLIGLIVARIPANDEYTVQARMPLIENLWEEAGDGLVESAHSTLMDTLMLSPGIPPSESHIEPLPTTRRFIDLQFELAERNPISGVGAFCYANEYLALKEYPPIQAATVEAFPGADIRFFEANWEADGHHTELAEQSIAMLCRSEQDFSAAKHGVEQAIEARVGFYDGICKELNL